jgi:hypothetical protein
VALYDAEADVEAAAAPNGAGESEPTPDEEPTVTEP